MWFVLTCGWCGEENVLWGERTGFWNNRFRLDDEFECWSCGGDCVTHAPPWTPYEG